jgi:hypothetical protein
MSAFSFLWNKVRRGSKSSLASTAAAAEGDVKQSGGGDRSAEYTGSSSMAESERWAVLLRGFRFSIANLSAALVEWADHSSSSAGVLAFVECVGRITRAIEDDVSDLSLQHSTVTHGSPGVLEQNRSRTKLVTLLSHACQQQQQQQSELSDLILSHLLPLLEAYHTDTLLTEEDFRLVEASERVYVEAKRKLDMISGQLSLESTTGMHACVCVCMCVRVCATYHIYIYIYTYHIYIYAWHSVFIIHTPFIHKKK